MSALEELFPDELRGKPTPELPQKKTHKKLPPIFLIKEQEEAILKVWNESDPLHPPSVMSLVKAAWPTGDFDGRSAQGRAVLDFLAQRKLKAVTAATKPESVPLLLSDEQKEYIYNNCETMGALEMAKILFQNPNLSPLHRETRAVIEVLKNIVGKEVKEEITETGEYRPPKNITKAVQRINRYLKTLNLTEEKLNSRDKKNIIALIAYLHTYRFVRQINEYDKIEYKELFESSFIRYTWDKGDLMEEEVDQYIMVASEVVNSVKITEHINDMQKLLEVAQQTNEDNKKFSMSLVEAMAKARGEFNDCSSRQTKLLQTLAGKRSERLASQKSQTASILNLVQLWKEEETRNKLIELSEKRRALVRDEINRLSNLDDVQAIILGVSEDDVLNG